MIVFSKIEQKARNGVAESGPVTRKCLKLIRIDVVLSWYCSRVEGSPDSIGWHPSPEPQL